MFFVHGIEHLQPEDMQEQKRRYKEQRRKGGQAVTDPFPHLGSHPECMLRLESKPNNRKFLQNVFGDLIRFLRGLYDQGTSLKDIILLFVCKYGKHRSFAAAVLTDMMLGELGCIHRAETVACMENSFGAASCGRNPCELCDSRMEHEGKREVVQFFLARFRYLVREILSQ